MVETFAKEYLGAEVVVGTEIQVTSSGRATGFVKPPGVLLGVHKKNALKAACDGNNAPDVGLGDRKHDYPFLAYCKVWSLSPLNHVYGMASAMGWTWTGPP